MRRKRGGEEEEEEESQRRYSRFFTISSQGRELHSNTYAHPGAIVCKSLGNTSSAYQSVMLRATGGTTAYVLSLTELKSHH